MSYQCPNTNIRTWQPWRYCKSFPNGWPWAGQYSWMESNYRLQTGRIGRNFSSLRPGIAVIQTFIVLSWPSSLGLDFTRKRWIVNSAIRTQWSFLKSNSSLIYWQFSVTISSRKLYSQAIKPYLLLV